ncbi:hypothetical protein DYQ91_04350 [Xanthomonas sp. LMG 8989]|nr:hypothetical protein [Xanthomonas sp. LMG 8989]
MSAMGMAALRRSLPAARRVLQMQVRTRRLGAHAAALAGRGGREIAEAMADVPKRARRPWPCRTRCSESTDDVLPRNVIQQQRSRRRFDMTAPASAL